MKLLPLTNSDRLVMVDDDIFEQVKERHWRLIKVSNGAVYVGWKSHKKGKDVTIYLHRLVMGFPKGQVDHEKSNIFDCRRESLRTVTHSQNQMNSKGQKHSSIYKNVTWNKQRQTWKAQLRVDGQDFFIGYFDIERHAAEAADLNLSALHGEFARFNFVNALKG